ncbi:MAG: HAMP domain-containing sensor histidine kinase [Candidatus Margulisiibacteriota bacterium]
MLEYATAIPELIIALLITHNFNRRLKKGIIPSPHSILLMDYFIGIIGLYINGGAENPYYFVLAIFIFVTGYLFSLRVSMGYAIASSILVCTIFALEYFGILPHIVGFKDYKLYMNREYVTNYAACLVMLYICAAYASGKFHEAYLKASQRLREMNELKTRFMSVISHEIKSPLAPIYQYSEMLEDGDFGELTDEQKRVVKSVRRQSMNLSGLIDNLLDIGRLDLRKEILLRKGQVSFQQIVDDVFEAMQFEASKYGLTLDKEIASDLPRVEADERAIRRVFMNLIGNAVKFTQKGGQIRLKVLLEDNNLKVSVSDTGVGLDPQSIKHVFDEYYQVGKQNVGLGMGLSLCKMIVEAHGGKIWVESEGEGKGTTFYFTIPVLITPREEPA